MKIPEKYQIFDTPVILPDKDADRLEPYLTGWPKLHTLFMLGINEPDTRRLVVLELIGAQRREILRRLLMREGRLRRIKIQKRLKEVLR